jgi:hypothetical protein
MRHGKIGLVRAIATFMAIAAARSPSAAPTSRSTQLRGSPIPPTVLARFVQHLGHGAASQLARLPLSQPVLQLDALPFALFAQADRIGQRSQGGDKRHETEDCQKEKQHGYRPIRRAAFATMSAMLKAVRSAIVASRPEACGTVWARLCST